MKKILIGMFLFLAVETSKAASYSDLQTIAGNSIFEGRCIYALETAAIAVMNESSTTAHHLERVNYARPVLSGSINSFTVSDCVLTNPSIAAEANVATVPDFNIPDSDIQFQVNSIFNALAGISN